MLRKHLIVDALITLIIIIYLEFFSFTMLSEDSILKYPAIFATGMVLVVIFFICIIEKKVAKHPIDRLVILFICSMVLSSLMSYLYWGQTFFSSIKAYSYFYIYFLYFLLIYLNISFERIERIIVFLFFLSIIVFFIDFITFPNPLFAWRNEARRDGITVFFYGQGFTFLGAFYFLAKYFNKKKLIKLGWYIISFICLFILTQSRQNLLALIFGFFLLLFASNSKRKLFVTILVTIVGGVFYLNSGMFKEIQQETKAQAQSYNEDIRVLAQKYFLTELQGGVPTMLFGNGIPGKNSRLLAESVKGSSKGFFISDVGLTGIYSYFGLFGLSIWLLFFYYVFSMKSNQDSNYLKAYFLALLTTAFAGYSIFEPGYMPATILALYLVKLQASAGYKTVYYILGR